jgi:DNA invertase Pin-like site-specific DNA recombinase
VDGYVRVSRRLGREGPSYISPTVQREAIERWATYKGLTIQEWHVDEDWSGGTHKRPGLERAVGRALAGESGGIVSWKIDRFSRQTEGGLRDLRRLQEAGARLAFVVEDIDTATTYGKMVYTILLAVSEAFLESNKASWEVAKRRAVERGAYVSRTPWGYRRREDGTLEPHPERADIVAEAFRLAASDSLQAATRYLAAAAPERSWNATKARRLLSQRSYLGETRNGEHVQVGTHAALVSRAVWEAAQTTPSVRRASERFPLSGLLTCDTCGSAMVGGRGGTHGQRTYRCGRQTCPARPVITAERVETYILEIARNALAGLRVTVGDPQADVLTGLERDVVEAEAELDAFAADLTLRRALGDRYHQHLEARAAAVEAARDRYRRGARDAQSTLVLGSPDVLEDPELAPTVLRGLFARLVVCRGRGLPVERRVLVVPVDSDGPPGVAGAERAE